MAPLWPCHALELLEMPAHQAQDHASLAMQGAALPGEGSTPGPQRASEVRKTLQNRERRLLGPQGEGSTRSMVLAAILWLQTSCQIQGCFKFHLNDVFRLLNLAK